MDQSSFERLVGDSVMALPSGIRDALENVAFVIEDRARRAKEREVGIMIDQQLLGLYEGVPKIARGANYFGVLPDKITIFKEPIEKMSDHRGDLEMLVRDVVWHEIGHHLGFDDGQLRVLEEKRAQKSGHHLQVKHA